MSKLGAWLLGLVGPLVFRALKLIGFSVVSFVGLRAVFDMLIGQVQGAVSGLPSAVLNIVAMAGFFQAISLMASAFLVRLAMVKLKELRIL